MTVHDIETRGTAGAGAGPEEVRLRGVGASPGVAIGYAFVIPSDYPPIVRRPLRPEAVPAERDRLSRALAATRAELVDIREKLRSLRGGEEAKIFDAHLLMLDDPHTVARAHARIADGLLNAEAAFFDVLTAILGPMQRIEDPYLRERSADLRDVKRRVLKNLAGRSRHMLSGVGGNAILIANDLSPTVTAELDKDRVLGFATEVGSSTSHTAILARSLEIPAAVALGPLCEVVGHGETLVVDGREGLLIRHPSEATVEHYHRVAVGIQRNRARQLSVCELPSETHDGRPFAMHANIEIPREVEVARLFGAEGIGLFRTEFLFLRAGGFPDEEDQLSIYRRIVEGMRGRPVTIRTLDLGGDKMAADPYAVAETNPFLGWRGIRYSLDHPAHFRAQLRAILRASAHGPVRIMFPLISTVEEMRRARAAAEDVWRELVGAGVPLGEPVQLGAMVETPGAALVAEALAEVADFLSIGTNDLTQYTLAVDRGNLRVAGLFRPLHPGVLHLIERTVGAARRAGIEVTLCGEMASSARNAVLLLGMGLRCFSMIASKIPRVKIALRGTTVAEAEALWAECRGLRTAAEIEALLGERVGARLREIVAGRMEGDVAEEERVEAEGAG